MEALFIMGKGEYAMERTRKRFDKMVNDPERSTLYEGWEIGSREFGGGTTNHARSGKVYKKGPGTWTLRAD